MFGYLLQTAPCTSSEPAGLSGRAGDVVRVQARGAARQVFPYYYYFFGVSTSPGSARIGRP